MRKYLFFSVLFFTSLLCNQCNRPESSIPHINLDASIKSDTLRFSDLAENIHVVPLETFEDIYISSAGLSYWVSDKYIIVLSDKAILQFSADGTFIRKLASEGKGPNEYQYMGISFVDEKNDILYFTSQTNDDKIYAIDLKSGFFRESVNIRPFGRIQGIGIKDNNLLLFPEKPVIFLTTSQGKLIDSLSLGYISGEELLFFTTYPNYIAGEKEKTFFELRDTIFELNFPHYKPVVSFSYKDKFDTQTNLKGKNKKVRFNTSDYFLLTALDVEMERFPGGGYSIQINFIKSYTLTKENFTIKDINNFIYLDFWDIRVRFYSFRITGSKAFIALEPIYIKSEVKKKKEKEESIHRDLEILANSLSEEDNAVIIVGDLK